MLIRHRAPICATVLLAAVFWASVCASRPSGTTALLRLVSPRQANLRRLWVANDESSSLTPIDPATGHVRRPVPVADPHNLYLTPNGRRAIVVAERLGRLDTRSGRLLPRVRVGRSPHGLCVYPQPGRYSLGHTGVFR